MEPRNFMKVKTFITLFIIGIQTDRTVHSVASDLGLHCLPFIRKFLDMSDFRIHMIRS